MYVATCGKTEMEGKGAQANPWSGIWSRHRRKQEI